MIEWEIYKTIPDAVFALRLEHPESHDPRAAEIFDRFGVLNRDQRNPCYFTVDEDDGVLCVTLSYEGVCWEGQDYGFNELFKPMFKPVEEFGYDRVVVDLKKIDALDKRSLSLLCQIAKSVKSANGRFALCNASAGNLNLLRCMKIPMKDQ